MNSCKQLKMLCVRHSPLSIAKCGCWRNSEGWRIHGLAHTRADQLSSTWTKRTRQSKQPTSIRCSQRLCKGW